MSAASQSDVSQLTPRLSVVVPAYNEAERLGASLTRMAAYFEAQSYEVEVLIVDDGSTDATKEIALKFAETNPRFRLLSYDVNRGKGHAVRYGMLRATGQRILFCDADLATPIEEVEKLAAALDVGADIAIGSRDVKGSELMKRQSLVREMGGRAFNQMVQLLAVPGIHDTQCGFKLFTQSASQRIFNLCQVDHFAFDVEVLYLAVKVLGLRVTEVPVRWAHQEGSKVRFFRDALRMVKTLFRIRATRYAVASAKIAPTP